jgi:hypothetical protein
MKEAFEHIAEMVEPTYHTYLEAERTEADLQETREQ